MEDLLWAAAAEAHCGTFRALIRARMANRAAEVKCRVMAYLMLFPQGGGVGFHCGAMFKICALLFLCLLVVSALSACASAASVRIHYNLLGVWIGGLEVGYLAGSFHPEISFTLFPDKNGISGLYSCWQGGADCPHSERGGTVSISDPYANPLSMHVLLKDGSRCVFQGIRKGDEITGGRVCYGFGGAVTNSLWYIRRAY